VSDLQTGVIESPGMAITDDIARLVAIMVRQHQGQRAATLRRAVYGDTPPTACPGSRRHAGPAPASSRRGRTAPPPPRIQEGLAWLAHLYSIQPHGRRLPTIDLDLEGAIRRGGSHQTSDVPLAVMAAPQVDHPTCQRCGFARSHVREVTRLHPYTDQEVRVRWCVDCRGEQRSTVEHAADPAGCDTCPSRSTTAASLDYGEGCPHRLRRCPSCGQEKPQTG
jgi:hypothetical protein